MLTPTQECNRVGNVFFDRQPRYLNVAVCDLSQTGFLLRLILECMETPTM